MSPQIHRSGYIYHGRFDKHWTIFELYVLQLQTILFVSEHIDHILSQIWNWRNICWWSLSLWWENMVGLSQASFVEPWLVSKMSADVFPQINRKHKKLEKELGKELWKFKLRTGTQHRGKCRAGQQYVSQRLSKNQSEEQTGEELVKKLKKKIYFQVSGTQHFFLSYILACNPSCCPKGCTL